jgi:bifunctional UDP-N-acetylglucosamine pyrophosphorylase/glucosamine-1-phosphate N-acetyltransferase
MLEGVRFMLPQSNHLDYSVTIGSGSIIHAGVQLFGNTHIGHNCHIHSFSIISNTTLEDNVTILPNTVIDKSIITSSSSVGPHAHIQGKNAIGRYVAVDDKKQRRTVQ